MDEHEKTLRLDGIVRASGFASGVQGKQFLGVIIECCDGGEWIVDYDEQSPYHAFADRQVVVSGTPCEVSGRHLSGTTSGRKQGNRRMSTQHLIRTARGQTPWHLRVSTMRLAAITPDAEIVAVGAEQRLCGRFERATCRSGESTLAFVTLEGDTFLVANDPAGATVGRSVEVCAYPVQLSTSVPRPPGRYLWIICPCSADDIWEWRRRHA
ncbi:hypothetical protein ACFL6M_08095 [Candidatus Eisenbacteria bacterium]|uniref:Uncharacterized protein n=1 Tax=Eiseniibacteriota bacterium TaxID=2212470 RepID=A0ABV6YMI9_UNCEI